MPSVADALRQFAPAYLKQNPGSVSTIGQKVLAAIVRCRTGALGGVHYQCDGCGREHWVGRSCGNRHCPNCGHEKTQLWIEAQSVRLMPVHHFLVTFTVPRELGSVLRTIKRTVTVVCSMPAVQASVTSVRRPSHYAVACWGSSVCCIRGGVTLPSIIRTFTMSFPAAE